MLKLIKWLASVVAACFLVPIIQAPAVKLAETLGIDTLYTKRWEASVAFLSKLAENPLYLIAFGFVVGRNRALAFLAFSRKKQKRG